MRTVNELLVQTIHVGELLGLIEPHLESIVGTLTDEEFDFYLQELLKIDIPERFHRVTEPAYKKYYHIGEYLSFGYEINADKILIGIANQVVEKRKS